MKIVVSNSTRGAYRGVLEILQKNLEDGGRHIVLAPDRFTASVERGLISSLKRRSLINLEVMSFTRLADKLIGRDIKKCLTPEGSVMLLGRVLEERRGQLGYYANASVREGFAAELYAALTAVRNSGISSAGLLAASENMPVYLKMKSRDIALIYEGYLEALEGRHSDSSTRLYTLAERLNSSEGAESLGVRTLHFYCMDFYDFKAPELQILKGLSRNALSLTVGATSGYDYPNKRVYPDRVIKKLCLAAEDRALIIHNDEEFDDVTGMISERLFSYKIPQTRVENNGKVVLRRAKDRYDEIMRLALDIVDRTAKGARYRDFEVFTSDIERYAPEIKSIFGRYKIPFFIDKKELLIEQTKVRFLLSALASVRSGFNREEVLDFVKNPLFVSRVEGGQESVFEFENYIIKYNINRDGFLSEFDFCFDSGGLQANSQERPAFEYTVPEKVRSALVLVISPLCLKGEKSLPEFASDLRKFSDGFSEEWHAHAELLSDMSAYYKKVAEQVDDKLNGVLDEISSVANSLSDIAAFENIFRSMLQTLKIALVPTYLDCVFVGDKDSRYMGAGDLYILGAVSSAFPALPSGGAVLTPKDEELLSALGVDINPNERQKVLDNMYAVLELMKKPHGRLVLSYPETGEGESMRPSSVIAELKGMLCDNGLPLEEERIDFEHISSLDAEGEKAMVAGLFSTKKGCYHEVLRSAVSGRASGGELKYYRSAYSFIDGTDKNKLDNVFDPPERIVLPEALALSGTTSVSRIESFYSCPYAHYFNYILKLKKRKDSDFEGTENGIVIHYVLERFYKALKDGKVNRDNTAALAARYFDDALKKFGYERFNLKSRTQRAFARLKRECARICGDLYDIYLRSSFKPVMLEARIGEGKIQPISLEVCGEKIALSGVIDRVDLKDGKFIVVDYKTYKSANLSLSELYYGEKIQLYVYMKAVQKSLNATPVGVFYLPVYAGFCDGSDGRYKFRGHAPDNLKTLEEIDSLFASSPAESVLPYKADKDGALKPDVHLSPQQLDALGDYALKAVAKGAEEIRRGYIKPLPASDSCRNCAYSGVCAYREQDVRRFGRVDVSVFGQLTEDKK